MTRFQKTQKIAGGIFASAAVISFLLGCAQAAMLGKEENVNVPVQMFYTNDDGKTHFADDASKLVPFDKDGKPAVRCYIFTCDDRKTTFIAYLERLTPAAKDKMEEAMKAAGNANAHAEATDLIIMEGTEVKKPGDAKWVKRSSDAGEKVTNVACPDGKTEKLNIVLPND